ncbi:MAG: type II secretion system secretin GspD [Bryobacteraceae bacterium]
MLLLAALAAPAAFGQSDPSKPPQPQQQQQQPLTTKAPGMPGQTAPAPAAPQPTPTGQATPAQTAPVTAAPPQSAPPSAAPSPVPVTGFDYMIPNASLTEFIDIMARRLKINYILDPAIRQGSVTLYTYGEVKPVDLMTLLQTVLRVNGATMVQVGDLYRIVPINKISSLPMPPMTDVDPKTLPDDERMILDLIFLKYTTAKEIDSLISPFLGEGASHSTYDPANLLILQDNARNMKRTMQLIDLFDSDTFAGQRVRLFDITNSRPSDLVKDLDTVFHAFALSDKASAVKFIPVDRINTIIAVAPNPGIFAEVRKWIEKFDVPVKITAGATGNYVYRLKYARAETVAMAIMALYTGNINALVAMAQQMNNNMFTAGIGMSGGGGYGGMNGGGYGGMNGGGYGGGYGGMSGGMNGGMNAYGGSGYGGFSGGGYSGGGGLANQTGGLFSQGTAASGASASGAARDLTGNFLGNAGQAGGSQGGSMPVVVPNPFDNTLIIKGSAQEIEQIKDLLRQLDVAPRQILIDAKIYEVDLQGSFSAGVESYLQALGTNTNGVTAHTGAGGALLTLGEVVLHSKQLYNILNLQENRGRTRVVSAPSIIATDSVPATMNVGDQVPIATSQAAVGGVTVGGTTPFANTIGSASTGVTFSIIARANSSGIVTMIIDQQVSAPEAPPLGVNTAVQSSSFSNRSVSTQITVQDGDTVAIGGIIMEKYAESNGGIPLLYRIPIIGPLFGSKSITSSRTELIIFLTPRVIYDTNQMVDATDEIRTGLKTINKLMKANKDDQ